MSKTWCSSWIYDSGDLYWQQSPRKEIICSLCTVTFAHLWRITIALTSKLYSNKLCLQVETPITCMFGSTQQEGLFKEPKKKTKPNHYWESSCLLTVRYWEILLLYFGFVSVRGFQKIRRTTRADQERLFFWESAFLPAQNGEIELDKKELVQPIKAFLNDHI